MIAEVFAERRPCGQPAPEGPEGVNPSQQLTPERRRLFTGKLAYHTGPSRRREGLKQPLSVL